MTEQTESLAEALEDRDITLALTPAQLLLLAIGIIVLVRILRSRRG